MKDFNGSVAVVTGGASGIGRSLVKQLLTAGARVVVGDVEQGALDALLEEFRELGELRGVVTDVSDSDSVNALAEPVGETAERRANEDEKPCRRFWHGGHSTSARY